MSPEPRAPPKTVFWFDHCTPSPSSLPHHMFGRNKENKKPKKGLNSILLGVVVGGAIGSVVGMSVAPESGKETRKKIGHIFKKLCKIKKKTNSPDQESITAEELRKVPHD